MRITNRTMTNNLLMNLNRGMGRLHNINQQLSSKKQINLPSDDPVKAGIILRMSSSVRETDQYLRNVDSARSWLEAADIVYEDVLSVIHRAKELANRGANTHLDETSKKALADEVYQLHDSLIQLANSTHGGRYLFAGQHTLTKPFTLAELEPEGEQQIPKVLYLADVDLPENNSALEFEIGVGVTLDVSTEPDTAAKLFGGIFHALRALHGELMDYDTAESGSEPESAMGLLDVALDTVLQELSDLGGRQNRAELARERLLDLKLNLQKVLSEEQDLDYAEAIMELKMEEFAYRTALSVGARIIQPSLIDFLR